MAVEYCHRGGHYIDLDYHVEGKYVNGTEWCCWEHLTEDEQEELENE